MGTWMINEFMVEVLMLGDFSFCGEKGIDCDQLLYTGLRPRD